MNSNMSIDQAINIIKNLNNVHINNWSDYDIKSYRTATTLLYILDIKY